MLFKKQARWKWYSCYSSERHDTRFWQFSDLANPTSMKNSFQRIILVTWAVLLCTASVWAFGELGANVSFDDRGPSRKQLRIIKQAKLKIKKLHHVIGPTRPGDWLESHKESGQTYRQYTKSNPVRLTKERNVLYVVPLGEFNEKQEEIVKLSTEFLGLYFNCKTKQLPTISLDEIPAKARRVHPSWGVRQILSTYVLNDVLRPKLPDDAAALIALTSSDLYPADDWNFVFGQASLRHRVGVWSIFRNGDLATEFKTVLRRTLQTATHETGHMFSIKHCIAYECNMCGSNGRAESDRRPLYCCPECAAKIWWATDSDPAKRYERLVKFCEKNDLTKTAEFFQKSVEQIRGEATK